ncbi:MAG: bacillithiol system redox-active protein YtxJ [Planctomycetes bacterium]|nr:bacillithiol system redox-active protein YtxJ [Planctomycetota bacterium]MCC7169656.1 bacillithiol system redox-active protein YtxJ [Planctomycetota bacterium]
MSGNEKSSPTLLRSVAELDAALAVPGVVLLFKHSTACPISAAAYDEYLEFLGGPGRSTRSAVIRVIEERPVSNHAATELGVRHESPQALLVRDGKLVWNASHRAITSKALAQAVRDASK